MVLLPIDLILQGKHKPTWTPHADAGDFVIVVNAAKVQLTGRKSETKTYYDYSGYHGGLKHTTYGRMQERRPTEIVRLAVRRMLPKTDLGRLIASAMMLVGWGTLAVPTGIVSAEFVAQKMPRETTTRTCPECLTEGHLSTARFCRDCGARLPPWQSDRPPPDVSPPPAPPPGSPGNR